MKIFYSLIIVFVLIFGYTNYVLIYKANINTEEESIKILIKEEKYFDENRELLKIFKSKSEFLNYIYFFEKRGKAKIGNYIIPKDFTNREVYNMLVSGAQTPIVYSFNQTSYIREVAKVLGGNLNVDVNEFVNYVYSPTFLEKNNVDSLTVIKYFFNDTYEEYWTATPKKIMFKYIKYYKKFWDKNRLEKAKKMRLTPLQVHTLASIVQSETNDKKEYRIVAGVYLNRLQKGMRLQADPTIKYALFIKNKYQEIKRILRKDLFIDSPFNTYRKKGLPPAPISTVDKDVVDAVLNAQKHDFIYMCANPSIPGTHLFTSNYKEHQRNAIAYRRWLKSRSIYR